MAVLPALLLSCIAIDGDTLRCGKDRYRLLGIDVPDDVAFVHASA